MTTRYVDVEKLKAEIERQQRRLILLATNTEQASVKRDCALQNGVYDHILSIINSLQQEQTDTDIEEQDDNKCPVCGWSLDAAGCCGCCGYGRR